MGAGIPFITTGPTSSKKTPGRPSPMRRTAASDVSTSPGAASSTIREATFTSWPPRSSPHGAGPARVVEPEQQAVAQLLDDAPEIVHLLVDQPFLESEERQGGLIAP